MQDLIDAQFGRYALASTLTALSWDFLTHLDSELSLLTIREDEGNKRESHPTVIYFASRVFTLSDVLAAVTFTTNANVSCEAASVASTIFFLLGHISTLSLFFLRVRAIFFERTWIVRAFFALWLATAGCCVAVAFFFKTREISGSSPISDLRDAALNPWAALLTTCVQTTFRPICAACLFATFVHDTAVFVAVSAHLINRFADQLSPLDRITYLVWPSPRRRKLVTLPAIARTLLHGGQQYYLVSLAANVAMIAMTFMPSVAPATKSNLAAPYATLVNILACKVFRDVKLGDFHFHPGREENGDSIEGSTTTVSMASFPMPLAPRMSAAHNASPRSSERASTLLRITYTIESTTQSDADLEVPVYSITPVERVHVARSNSAHDSLMHEEQVRGGQVYSRNGPSPFRFSLEN